MSSNGNVAEVLTTSTSTTAVAPSASVVGRILFCAPTGVGHATPMLAFAIGAARLLPDFAVTVFTPFRIGEVSKLGMIDQSRAPANLRHHKYVLPGPVDPVTMEGMSRFSKELQEELLSVESNPTILVHDPFALYASQLSRTRWPNTLTYLFCPSPYVVTLFMMMGIHKIIESSDPHADFGWINVPGLAPIPTQTGICASMDLERHPDPTLVQMSSLFGANLRGMLANDSVASFPGLSGLTSELLAGFLRELKAKYPQSEVLKSYSDDFKMWHIQETIAAERVAATADDRAAPLMTWLGAKPSGSVVVICFGTLYTPNEEDLHQLESALAVVDRPTLYVSRNPSTKERLSHLQHVRVEQWVPLLNVLAHEAIGMSIMHGGWNTLQENFYYAGEFGKPVVLVPLGSDQFVLAELIQRHFGAGTSALVCLKDFNPPTDTTVEAGIAEIQGALRRIRNGLDISMLARPQHPEFYRYFNKKEWVKALQQDRTDQVENCKRVRKAYVDSYEQNMKEQVGGWIEDFRGAFRK